jgi:hypothetical protein
MTIRMQILDDLADAIQTACRELARDPRHVRGSELTRRESALQAIDEILQWRPLASFSASQLELLETLVAYWRECEVEAGAPEPDRLH